jgi:hypothetical protein
VAGHPTAAALDQDGVTVTAFAFHVAGDRITHIWAIRNPDKLPALDNRLTLARLPSDPLPAANARSSWGAPGGRSVWVGFL